MAAQQYGDSTIGSTVAALLAYDRQCACLWVGDSRIYRLRDNNLEQLTRDHSVVEEYIADGIMTPQEAYNSSVANALTRAIGAQNELSIDVRIEEMRDGDSFLLCSDGLYREVSLEKMTQLVTTNSDSATISKQLLNSAIEHGAKDNVTVSVVQINNA
jgi:serine/threonine protein phosphatase PrpC